MSEGLAEPAAAAATPTTPSDPNPAAPMKSAPTKPAEATESVCPADVPWQLAEKLYPRQGKWNVESFLALEPILRVELVDGSLEFLSMPEHIHHDIIGWLNSLLMAILGRGSVCPDGYRLRTPDGLREPDVIATLDRKNFGRRYATGADFVVEVISPGQSNRHRDEVTKVRVYAQAGIGEYWIIDPEAQTVRQLVLGGDAYREAGVFGRGQTVASAKIEGLTVSLDEMFSPLDDRPSADAAQASP